MATAELTKSPSGLSERGIVLEGISWETYEKFVAGVEGREFKVAYDNGLMEIEMSPSRLHESDTDLLCSLVVLIRTLRGIPIESGGSTTHKRHDLAKSVEPDGCYWIKNEQVMRGVQELDLLKHPAPDLVIEVDLTSSSVNKIDIYKKLSVPEIWHLTPEKLEFLMLTADHSAYQAMESSLSFPFVQRAPVEAAIKASKKVGESAALDQLLTDLKLR